MSEEQYSKPEYVETAQDENREQFVKAAPRKMDESRPEPWLTDAEIDELQSRWNSVQIEFIDEPHASVEQAEVLVAETADKISRMLAEKKMSLDETWTNRSGISTEDLRTALQRYRAFFNRLLAM